MNPIVSTPAPANLVAGDARGSLNRPKEKGSAWVSFFISVIVHINVLLILAVTFRALQDKDDPPVVIDTVFTPGEEEEIAISTDTEKDMAAEEALFEETAPLTAEEMVRTDQKLDLAGLQGVGGALGIGGGIGGGGVGFFGTSARGRSFVFVVDCSGSMQGSRFNRAVSELRKSLSQLKPHQQFQVIFFNSQAIPLIHSEHRTKLLPATASVLEEAFGWIDARWAQGGTVPDDALRRALALEPDVVFFLTDADSVPRSVRTLIAERNKHGSTVHTIAFGHRGGETLMQGIAADHHGRYRFVP